jgi:four helix bundle protein
MGAKHYWELTAWQAVRAFKVGIYDLIEREPLANDFKLREQLRESVASAQSHIAEGYGRFDPLDFARFVKMSRASMLECHNHLGDAVDRKRITEDIRREHLVRWDEAMKEIGGLLDYLQSPEAKRNADRLRQQRIRRRQDRKNRGATRNPEPQNHEPKHSEPENREPANPELENLEPANLEPENPAPGNQEPEPGTR